MQASDKTIKVLASALNFRQMKQEIISSNIANADTPEYKAKRLNFEEALKRAINVDQQQNMRIDDTRHYDVGGGGFKNLQPEVINDPNGMVSEDGNTVNRDEELARLAENRVLYNAAVELLNKKLAIMKYALSGDN